MLKRFLTALLRRQPRLCGRPVAGDLYAFRTAPISEFASPETGRYAALKILGSDDRQVAVAVLDGIWSRPPSLEEARSSSILLEHRFALEGRPVVFGLNAEWWMPDVLDELALLGDDRLSREERALARAIASLAIGTRHSTLTAANRAAEGEWRWANDRDAFVAETERKQAKAEAARAAKEERYRTRLRDLSWEQLLAETPFQRWSPSPPFPPEEFTTAARAVVHDACRALGALGPKPRKAQVRAVLRNCVNWFNHADERAGHVIETEEREDICAVLEELAFVARQPSLVDEIDEWREW